MSDTYQDALILIASVRAALTNGVLHYQDGVLLETETEIIEAMMRGAVEFDESQRVERTTSCAELERLRS